MKQFKKKGGFTLVEIIIAFAIFAIMASMIVQVLNLTINRRQSNNDFQKDMENQEQNLYAKKPETSYDSSTSKDGSIILNFGDTSMTVDYQLKSAKDGVTNEKAGINYLVGDVNYDVELEGSFTEGDEEDPNKSAGSQTDRFDARITGTRGISAINVNSVVKVDPQTYTITVQADTSGVQDDNKDYAQFSMYFGAASEGLVIEQFTAAAPTGLTVRKSGERGVKVGVIQKSTSLNQPVTFTVKFNKAPAEELTVNSFGANSVGGKYTAYSTSSGGKTYIYTNLYGVFPKTTPAAPGGESS